MNTASTIPPYTISLDAPEHSDAVEALYDEVFGPGRFAKTAERLRELRPGQRVLFMSGYTDDAVIRHGVLPAGTARARLRVTAHQPFEQVLLHQRDLGHHGELDPTRRARHRCWPTAPENRLVP